MKNIFYAAKVDDRIIEETTSEKRREELMEILPKVYPGRKIEIVQRRVVKVKVKYEAIFTYEVDADDEDFDAKTEVRFDLEDIGVRGNLLKRIRGDELDVEEIA